MINTPLIEKIAKNYGEKLSEELVNEIKAAENIYARLNASSKALLDLNTKYNKDKKDIEDSIRETTLKCKHLSTTYYSSCGYDNGYNQCDICGKEL